MSVYGVLYILSSKRVLYYPADGLPGASVAVATIHFTLTGGILEMHDTAWADIFIGCARYKP